MGLWQPFALLATFMLNTKLLVASRANVLLFAYRLLVAAAPKPLDDQSKLCGCAHVRGEEDGGGDDNMNKALRR